MRTHPESIWVDPEDINDGTGIGTFSDERYYDDDLEFVPATAYRELKAKLELALGVIERFGGIDGEHHKTWVIDQVARALTGDGYEKWVDDMKGATGDNGEREYDWDEGVAP